MRATTIPDSPPTLQNIVPVDEAFASQAQRIIGLLSRGLDGLPVVLSQQGEVIAHAGQGDASLAVEVARITHESWQQGATGVAREYLRFQEETFEISGSRLPLLFYSRHIEDALVLTVGWQLTVSLTQIRAEMLDARFDLLDARV